MLTFHFLFCKLPQISFSLLIVYSKFQPFATKLDWIAVFVKYILNWNLDHPKRTTNAFIKISTVFYQTRNILFIFQFLWVFCRFLNKPLSRWKLWNFVFLKRYLLCNTCMTRKKFDLRFIASLFRCRYPDAGSATDAGH